MSASIAKLKSGADKIQNGLFRLGKNRVAALPAHLMVELVTEMETTIAEMQKELQKLDDN